MASIPQRKLFSWQEIDLVNRVPLTQSGTLVKASAQLNTEH